MSIGENIKKLRLAHGLSQKQFAVVAGVTDKAVSTWETGQKIPRMDVIQKIAAHFGVKKMAIIDPSEMEDFADTARKFLSPFAEETKRVPIIGSVRCGPDGLAVEHTDGAISVSENLRGDIAAFRCTGDSMEGIGIYDGDIAIVRLQGDVENGELAVVVIDGEEGTLKRVKKYEDKSIVVLEAANPNYEARIFAREDANRLRIIGKVLETRHIY